MNLRSTVRNIRTTARYISAGPAEAEQQLIQAMSERVAEIVPGDCEVTTDRKTITLVNRSAGNTTIVTPLFILRSAFPADQRLTIAFEMLARSVQRFMASCGASSWPAPDAEPHAVITDETINVWWGGSTEADALVRLRPLRRGEIGV